MATSTRTTIKPAAVKPAATTPPVASTRKAGQHRTPVTLTALETQLRAMVDQASAQWETASAGIAQVIASIYDVKWRKSADRASALAKGTKSKEWAAYKTAFSGYWRALGIGDDAAFSLSQDARKAVVQATAGASLGEQMAMSGASMPSVSRYRAEFGQTDKTLGRPAGQSDDDDNADAKPNGLTLPDSADAGTPTPPAGPMTDAQVRANVVAYLAMVSRDEFRAIATDAGHGDQLVKLTLVPAVPAKSSQRIAAKTRVSAAK